MNGFSRSTTALALAAMGLLAPMGASAQSVVEAESTDVTQTTCDELAAGSELDRAFSLMFYYGYLAGREGISTIDASAVVGHLEAVRDYCTTDPESTVIDAFVSALNE